MTDRNVVSIGLWIIWNMDCPHLDSAGSTCMKLVFFLDTFKTQVYSATRTIRNCFFRAIAFLLWDFPLALSRWQMFSELLLRDCKKCRFELQRFSCSTWGINHQPDCSYIVWYNWCQSLVSRDLCLLVPVCLSVRLSVCLSICLSVCGSSVSHNLSPLELFMIVASCSTFQGKRSGEPQKSTLVCHWFCFVLMFDMQLCLRCSVGIEDVEDLQKDLEQALSKV